MMERKELIALLLKISAGMLAIMLFTHLSPIYQLIPVVLVLLTTLVLVVLEASDKQKEDYKKYQKKRSSSKS